MKLLQALFFPPEQPGGVSSMIPYILDRFQPPHWEMEMFSLPRRIRNKGNDSVEFQTFDWTDYGDSEIVQKYVQTYRDYIWWTKLRLTKTYDLIHAHHPIAALAMKHLYPDTPVIMTIHSSFERELILNGRIKEGSKDHLFLTSIYRELEAVTDEMMTVSESFKQYMRPYVQEVDLIQVLPNGFDEKRFKPLAHDNAVPQLITVCRLVPAKGMDILLEACALLKQRGHAYVLHIIGDGPIREELEAHAQRLGIYDETIFYGYMLHPEEFMPFSDIFILPSRAESFGSVFAEAALCMLALVGTNVGGISEQIEDGINGLLVPPDDPQALSEAMERVMMDPLFRYELARAASAKAKQIYSLSRVVNELKMTYLRYRK